MSVRSLTAVVIVGLVTLAVAGCGHGLSSGSATETPAPVDTQLGPDEPGTVVSWSEASSRVGQVITVEGPVVAARRASAGKGPSTVLIIGIGASDPGRFLAIIPYSLRAKFPAAPAQYFSGRLVRVTGKIVRYTGVPSITVTGRHKIRVVQ